MITTVVTTATSTTHPADHQFLNGLLDVLNFLPLVALDQHDAIVESLLVHLPLGLLQFFTVVLTRHLVALTRCHC